MGEDRKKKLSLVPPPYGDDTYKMSRATSKYRFPRRFYAAGERRKRENLKNQNKNRDRNRLQRNRMGMERGNRRSLLQARERTTP